MTKATSTKRRTPAPQELDQEVIKFRANFDQRSPLDEIVRQGAQEMLQAAMQGRTAQADAPDEADIEALIRRGLEAEGATADDDAVALQYGRDAANSAYREYYRQMLAIFRAAYHKHRQDFRAMQGY